MSPFPDLRGADGGRAAVVAVTVLVLLLCRSAMRSSGVRSRLRILADGPGAGGVARLRWGRLGLGALGLSIVAVFGPIPTIGLVAFALVAGWARRVQSRQRHERALSIELPEVLDAIVGVLRSGGSVLHGLGVAAELPLDANVRLQVDNVLAEVGRGGSVVSALRGWVDRAGDGDLRMTVALVDAATVSGGPLADALARVAAAMRLRAARRREVDALVGQARLSAMVLVVLPVAVLPLLDALGAVDLASVVADPVSRVAIVGGLALDVTGLFWMRRLVARIDA